MVDEVRVLRLLRSVTDAVATLRREGDVTTERRGDPMWLPGVKYIFITAIEASIDVAQHLCSSEGWGPPADNGVAMTSLAQHGVLSTDLAARLRQAVGFRNLLVYEYVSVDEAVVVRHLDDLTDLDSFVTALTSVAETQGDGVT